MTPDGRLSMMTCWPREPDITGATKRALKSVSPPGKEVTMRTTLLGYAWAKTRFAPQTRAADRNTVIPNRAVDIDFSRQEKGIDASAKRGMNVSASYSPLLDSRAKLCMILSSIK